MTTRHDLDQQLNTFLREGPTELPDESFEALRDRTERTSQRVILGPWRLPDMNRIIAIGLGTAAVVAALVIGQQLLNLRIGGIGTGQPTATPRATANPGGVIPLETPYLIWDPNAHAAPWDSGPSVEITVPGRSIKSFVSLPEYSAIELEGIGSDPPDGAGLIVFSTRAGIVVYGDPCSWDSTRPDAPATTVDEIVAALRAQASRRASEATDVQIGGYQGKSITLHTPNVQSFADCDRGIFATFEAEGDSQPARYLQNPLQIDELLILDVDGAIVILDAVYGPSTTPSSLEHLHDVIDTATFGGPRGT